MCGDSLARGRMVRDDGRTANYVQCDGCGLLAREDFAW